MTAVLAALTMTHAHSAPSDAAAFADLYDRHAGEIYRYVFRRSARSDLAEDLVAVVFLEAWRRRDQVDLAHPHVRAWLYGVATNVLRNHRRALRRHDAALRSLAATRPEVLTADEVNDRLEDERAIRELVAAMKGLPRVEQEIVALVGWSGLSYGEAAIALGVPVGTVRSRLSRARERLRHVLEPGLGEV